MKIVTGESNIKTRVVEMRWKVHKFKDAQGFSNLESQAKRPCPVFAVISGRNLSIKKSLL